jgi:hypothetical protein
MRLKHATPEQLAAAFRERYQKAKGAEVARLARKARNLIEDGTLTPADIRAAFGMTAVQFNAFRTRLNAKAQRLDELEAEDGE